LVLDYLFVTIPQPRDSEETNGIPLRALPKNTTNLLAYLHRIPLKLNIKQGSC